MNLYISLLEKLNILNTLYIKNFIFSKKIDFEFQKIGIGFLINLFQMESYEKNICFSHGGDFCVLFCKSQFCRKWY